MLRSGLFRHLFLSVGLLVLCSVALLAYLVAGQTERAELQTLEERLTTESLLAAHFLRRDDPAAPATARTLVDLPRAADTRLTIIAADGKVVADSSSDPERFGEEGE